MIKVSYLLDLNQDKFSPIWYNAELIIIKRGTYL